ncbi:hypothetical protein HYV70_03120 [Candidatus Uhrbacteria bacterium]|nr:hypothetical protein [Candidatus Uhrbacteria bacterium]
MGHKRVTGTNPPPGMEWEIGKTAASITFYHKAEAYLNVCKDDEEIVILQKVMEEVKNGTRTMNQYITQEQLVQLLEEEKFFALNRK